LPGLDEYNRFVNNKGQNDGASLNGSLTAEGEPVKKRGPGRPPRVVTEPLNGADVRYVLKNGLTLPIPVERTKDVGLLTNADVISWDRLPRHIQLLAMIPDPEEIPEEEVAEKYYTRGFRESRKDLIERLLNPTLTLEETARVLGVCPATVRRYTNRGILPHYRTVGQQRRFRLSDVLMFLEQQFIGKRGARKAAGSDATTA
jgi:excisionase family DNA binding protein